MYGHFEWPGDEFCGNAVLPRNLEGRLAFSLRGHVYGDKSTGQVAFYVRNFTTRAWHSTRTRVRALTIFMFGVGLGVIAGHYHHPLRRAGTAHQRPRRLRFHPCTETLPQEQQTQILTTTTGGL